jgi:periplasmic divalent cation tolerance protein
LRALHPYEMPEILQIPVSDGWPAYLAWVAAQCGRRT